MSDRSQPIDRAAAKAVIARVLGDLQATVARLASVQTKDRSEIPDIRLALRRADRTLRDIEPKEGA
jgi:hypothetical protein